MPLHVQSGEYRIAVHHNFLGLFINFEFIEGVFHFEYRKALKIDPQFSIFLQVEKIVKNQSDTLSPPLINCTFANPNKEV